MKWFLVSVKIRIYFRHDEHLEKRLYVFINEKSKRARKSEHLQHRILCREQCFSQVPNAHLLSTRKDKGLLQEWVPWGPNVHISLQGAKRLLSVLPGPSAHIGTQSPYALILNTLSVCPLAV